MLTTGGEDGDKRSIPTLVIGNPSLPILSRPIRPAELCRVHHQEAGNSSMASIFSG
jgi:hypothetical protein